MAGQDATQGGRTVSRGLAGAVMIGCLALGMLLGTIGNTHSAAPASGSNLRDAHKRVSEAAVVPQAAGDAADVLPEKHADVGSLLLPVDHADVASPVKASEVHAGAMDDPDEMDPLFPTNAQIHKAFGDVHGLDAEYSFSYDF